MASQPPFECLSHKLKGLYDNAQNETSGIQDHLCTGFITEFVGHNNFNEDNFKNVCKITIHYINDLIAKNFNLIHGCKYLYNRISDKLINSVQISIDHFTFYKTLLKAYSSIQDDLEIIINDVEGFSEHVFKKHKHLVDLYNHLEKIHLSADCDAAKDFVRLYEGKMVECIGVKNDDFCDELDRFKQDYETVMQNKSCDGVPKYLPSIHGHNKLVSIIITVSVTLFTSIVLFIMYKFTPFGSWIRPSKKRTKKTFRGMHVEENPIIHKYERQNRNAQNISYNIAYNSV